MIWLLALTLAVDAASPSPDLSGGQETGAPATAVAEAGRRLDDGGGVLRTAVVSERLRRARRGTRTLRIPVPRRPARRSPHQDDLAQGLGHAAAATLGVRRRDALARRVALSLLRSRLSPRFTRRGTPPRAA